MNDYVIITVNGTDYYCPANLIQYITSDLINTSNTTITLYRNLSDNSGSNYPYIRLASYSQPVLYNGSYNGSNLTIESVDFSSSALLYRSLDLYPLVLTFLTFLIAVVILIGRFKR